MVALIEGLFTLPRDILLEPIEYLSEAALSQFEHMPGDFALTRPQSRIPTHIVNDLTAKLLDLFREPVTITDAVIRFSRTEKVEPSVVLDEAFPMIRKLIETGMLLPSDSHLVSEIEFLFKSGESIGEFLIDHPVAIVLDTEVYRAQASDGAFVAIKIARLGSEERMRPIFAHEARILMILNGCCSPKLVAQGEQGGRPFFAMEWCQGVDIHVAAELVRSRDPIQKRELKSILLAVVDAYTQLHEKLVVHGDVHPRNVLICDSGKAIIIDFGHALSLRNPIDMQHGRGVVDLYMEPELARALIEQSKSPPPTPVGEQYSIAALLYFLLTGTHTHDFVLEKSQLLQQQLYDPPISFAERGILEFGNTECVLTRALEKNPVTRFASLKELRNTLCEALDLDEKRAFRSRGSKNDEKLNGFIDRVTLDGILMREGIECPSASINFGAAGLAYAMLRISLQRQDPSILAVADVWSQVALRNIESCRTTALTAPDLNMSLDLIGKVSLYHSNPGAICVAALVADAQADEVRRRHAIELFVTTATAEEFRVELVFGLSGLLLGCSLLLDVVQSTIPSHEQTLLLSLGNDLQNKLLAQICGSQNIGNVGLPSTFGVAHGYAGVFYSLLQWAQVSKADSLEKLHVRLREFASIAQPVGRGLVWPVSARNWNKGMQATWCNGAAGHLQLWLVAYEVLRDPIYLSLARSAAWTTYEAPCNAADLCCGSAGRAYSLLRFFRQSGDRIWLDRAFELSNHATNAIQSKQLRQSSLYRGEVGVCLLASELYDPDQARMPLFELTS